MRHEDEPGHDVETTPLGIQQGHDLIQVDVSDGIVGTHFVVGPEERQDD